jgi:hypothetical protein
MELAVFGRKLADGVVVTSTERTHQDLVPDISTILPHPTSARVPKVLDSYTVLTVGRESL